MRNNAKTILPIDGQLVNVIGDLAGIPIPSNKATVMNPVPGQPRQGSIILVVIVLHPYESRIDVGGFILDRL